jgi:NADH:ubiquinone oxidoreductase subunit 3 (subunit A)
MGYTELGLLGLAYIQPVWLGLLLFISWRTVLLDTLWFAGATALRQRLRSTRFFECAAYSRLNGWLRYSTQALGLGVLFILYDVDLIFFFAEVTHFEQWGWAQLLIAAAYAGLFIGGLIYDLRRYGFM